MFSVETHNLRKSYGRASALSGSALRDVSFHVKKGEIFGIIGPDGAGKTTLFRILTTLILPDKGTATIMGLDVVKDYRQIRDIVGYMPGKFSLYQDLSVEENLKFFATLFGTSIDENYYLIKDIYSQLEPFKKRKAGALSGGMKQKLALSCAMIHKPSVLFLDEPTTGVDPVSRREFWDMLKRLREHGLSIVVSTPYMDEATLCDRIALIRKGKFLDTDTPANIIAKFLNRLLAVSGDNMPKLLGDIRTLPGVFSCFAFGDRHHVVLDSSFSAKPLSECILQMQRALKDMGHKNISVLEIAPGVEDCYMYLDTMEAAR